MLLTLIAGIMRVAVLLNDHKQELLILNQGMRASLSYMQPINTLEQSVVCLNLMLIMTAYTDDPQVLHY